MRYYVGAESDREVGDGVVPKTDDWEADVEWADVVFDGIWTGDDGRTGQVARELREQGKAVVGGPRIPTDWKKTKGTRSPPRSPHQRH